jgi:hypothetical protein
VVVAFVSVNRLFDWCLSIRRSSWPASRSFSRLRAKAGFSGGREGWRRGWEFEVAQALLACTPTRGPRPLVPSHGSGRPLKGKYPDYHSLFLANARPEPVLR